jgi:hypothetical protein
MGVASEQLPLNADEGLAKGLENVGTVLATKVSWKRKG